MVGIGDNYSADVQELEGNSTMHDLGFYSTGGYPLSNINRWRLRWHWPGSEGYGALLLEPH